MATISSFKELLIWQKSMTLVVETYGILAKLPSKEDFALKNQMQKSAVSIPSNIAEGFGRNHTKDFIRFLNIALGSVFELQTQNEIANRLNYTTIDEYNNINLKCEEITKMTTTLISKLKQKPR
jgi:four helix bundle protein